MNILIIEDDVYLASLIERTFLKYSFANRINKIDSYEWYLHKECSLNDFDIVILDINLWKWHNKHWFMILDYIKTISKNLPVIIISSHSEYEFLEEAFAKWAHDYLIKPFRNRELQIRIERWFRNYTLSEYFSISNTLNYHEIIFNLSEYEFYIKNKKIDLTKSNKYLLSLLIIYREKLVTNQFLISKIWWFQDTNDKKNVRIKIMRLKKQLEQVGISDWVHTVRWEWYSLKKISA